MQSLYIGLAAICFVAGLTLLKLTPADSVTSAIWFMIFMGITAACIGVYNGVSTHNNILLPAIAGILFCFGNILLIHALQRSKNIGLVRVLMAGFEIILLLLVSLVVFKQSTSIQSIVLTTLGCFLLILASVKN